MLENENIIGVTGDMCKDCQEYFAAKSKCEDTIYYVADPRATHIFIKGRQINVYHTGNRVTEGSISPRRRYKGKKGKKKRP